MDTNEKRKENEITYENKVKSYFWGGIKAAEEKENAFSSYIGESALLSLMLVGANLIVFWLNGNAKVQCKYLNKCITYASVVTLIELWTVVIYNKLYNCKNKIYNSLRVFLVVVRFFMIPVYVVIRLLFFPIIGQKKYSAISIILSALLNIILILSVFIYMPSDILVKILFKGLVWFKVPGNLMVGTACSAIVIVILSLSVLLQRFLIRLIKWVFNWKWVKQLSTKKWIKWFLLKIRIKWISQHFSAEKEERVMSLMIFLFIVATHIYLSFHPDGITISSIVLKDVDVSIAKDIISAFAWIFFMYDKFISYVGDKNHKDQATE